MVLNAAAAPEKSLHSALPGDRTIRLRIPLLPTLEFEPHRLAANLSIIALIVLCALAPLMSFKPAPFTGDGSPARQMAYGILLMVTLYAAAPMQDIRRLFILPFSLTLVLIWCWLSLSWSLQSDIALRRLLLTTIVIWSIFLMVARAGYRPSLTTIRWCLILILIANYIAVLATPAIGIHQPGEVGDEALIGNWRGVMIQKNFAGAICAFTIMIFSFDARDVRKFVRLAVIVGAAFFLVKSMSKTSMGIMVLAMLCGSLFLFYNPRFRLLLVPIFTILIVVIGLGMFLNWETITAPYYSRDALTGRVQIWPAMFAYAQNHLMMGTGYGSFWNIGLGKSPIFEYANGWIVTYASQGHNGYIDLLVTIGLPGLILTILATLVVPIIQLLASLTISRQTGALLISFIIFAAGHNMTESSLMDRDTIVQIFLMIGLALTREALRKERTEPVHGAAPRPARPTPPPFRTAAPHRQ